MGKKPIHGLDSRVASFCSLRPFASISLTLALCLSAQALAQDSATYKMTFEGLWTADDIVDASLPRGAHFTQVVGAKHNSSTSLWTSGGTASRGVEDVAELGQTGQLLSEISANTNTDGAITAGSSFIGPTASVSTTFTVNSSHPLVSVLSMIAPSPDWFVGVDSQALYENNSWKDRVEIDLFPYDAGTEDGEEWSLSNPATSPQGTITRIRGTGKFNNNALARLTFERQLPAASNLSINNASVPEGDSGATDLSFTVTLDRAQSDQITVDWATSSTSSDTATAGTDYTAANGTLTFAAGDTSASFTVQVTGDQDVEGDETFTVTLSNLTGNGTLPSPATAKGTISDDDQDDQTVPGAPTGLSAKANGRTQINLSWTAPASDGGATISGYRIETSSDAGVNWETLESNTSSTGTSYSHTGLAPASTRHYRVSAINSVGAGTASNTASATTDSADREDDADGDGVADDEDAFPTDPNEWSDNDGDGLGDNADTDDDNDGIKDARDLFPFDPLRSEDSDGDGLVDERDPFPMDATRTGLRSYRFVDGTQGFGTKISSAGDFDQDGLVDLLIAGTQNTYFVSAAGLASADSADGATDHSITMSHMLEAGTAWSINGRYSLVEIGDISGDASPEFALGNPAANPVRRGRLTDHKGEAWVFSAGDPGFAQIDARDGTTDGRIDSTHLAELHNAVRIVGHDDSQAGRELVSLGDLDDDGTADMILTTDPKGSERGAVHVLSGSALWTKRNEDSSDKPSLALKNLLASGDFWKITSRHAACRLEFVTASNDFDGAGTSVVAIISRREEETAAYLIAITDLTSADAADGTTDGTLEVELVAGLPNSWVLKGVPAALHSLRAGDVDGDGRWDLVASGRAQSDPVHVLKGSGFGAADSLDGETDRIISLAHLRAPQAWKFEASGGLRMAKSLGDVDGDGLADLAFLRPGEQDGKLVLGKSLRDLTDAGQGLPLSLRMAWTYHDSVDMAFTNDIDADGAQELLVATQVDAATRSLVGAQDDARRSAMFAPPAGVYLLSSSDLRVLDLADGKEDGSLHLSQVSGDADDDGLSNLLEQDDDNDGRPDYLDQFPQDASEQADSDGDRVGDLHDDFPLDARYQFDTDGDGIADRQDDDDDGDGILDAEDAHLLDTDNDGQANFLDPDDDNDGTPDSADALPLNANEQLDTDGDGIGNREDADDDNDGVPDSEDVFPLDAAQSKDSDGDGVGDALDAFVLDAAESADFDGDGIGDVADLDDDNDGVVDTQDAFPKDPLRVADADSDGIADALDAFPKDPLRSVAASYEFTTGHLGLNTGLSTAGDIDGDGRADLLVGMTGAADAAYLVASSDLAAADAADGLLDRQIDLDLASQQANSWKLTMMDESLGGGFVVHGLEDYDSNGVADFLVGGQGSLFVVSPLDLARADAADGALDGAVLLDHIAAEPNSWRITSTSEDQQVGQRIAPVSDLDADGSKEILIGTRGARPDAMSPVRLYLLSLSGLSSMDAADGTMDGVISPANIASHSASWQVQGSVAAPPDSLRFASGGVAPFGPGFFVTCKQCSPATNGGDSIDAAYWIAASNLRSADNADGVRDGIVNLEQLIAQTGSWKLLAASDNKLTIGAALPDLDGDARSDLLVSTRDHTYFVSGAELGALDAADGDSDGTIYLHSSVGARSWRTERSETWSDWWRRFAIGGMAGLGEIEGRARTEVASAYNLLHAAPVYEAQAEELLIATGALTYSVPRAALQGLGGSQDIRFNNLVGPALGWRLVPSASRTPQDLHLALAGDVDLDQQPEMLVSTADSVMLLNRADFSVLDAADGHADRIISLSYLAGDSDGDGYEDLIDRFPHDEYQWVDRDGDGVSDGEDAFPFDANETTDTDQDGVGNNADADDDNDGVEDRLDHFPLDSTESADSDGDGVGDNKDAFPQDASETLDTDGDDIGNNADSDDDNDGVADEDDADPLDPMVKGNLRLLAVEFYQGPLARVWHGTDSADTSHLPLILGRQSVLALRIAHHARQAPEAKLSAGPKGDDAAKMSLQAVTDTSGGSATETGPEHRETTKLFGLPGSLLQDANEVLVMLDPSDQIDEDDESDNLIRIPLAGETLPRFTIRFVPIRTSAGVPDAIDTEEYMQRVYDLLPIADDYQAQVAAPHTYQGGQWQPSEAALELLHRWNNEAQEGELWHGVFDYPAAGGRCGYAFQGIGVAVSAALEPLNNCGATSQAQQIGHNFNLEQVAAGCGEDDKIDQGYPYPGGGLGPRRGWSFSEQRFVDADDGYFDFMSNCKPAFVSDYHFEKATGYRLQTAMANSRSGVPPRRLLKLRGTSSGSAGGKAPVHESIAITGTIGAYGNWSLYRASLSRLAARRSAVDAPYTLLLTDAGQSIIHEQPLDTHLATGASGEAVFSVRIPLLTEARRLHIQDRQGLVLLDIEFEL